MYARYRTRTQHVPKIGVYTRWFFGTPVVIERDGGSILEQWCDDVVGNMEGDNLLDLSSRYETPAILNGKWYGFGDPPPLARDVVDFPVAYRVPAPDPRTVFPEFTQTQKDEFAMDVIARTNPSTPHISVPTFIGELKDVPDLVRGWGGDLLEKVAKGYLQWRWAIKPMIRDLQSMCDFQTAVSNRVRWLTKLRDTGLLKRRCGLGKDQSQVDEGLFYMESQCAILRAQRTVHYTSEVWGTTQWKLVSGTQLPVTNEGMENLATRLTFGITGYESLQTAWELLPWSWFIDWFTSVGNLIAATNNTVPVTPQRTCLMRTTSSAVGYEYVLPSTPDYLRVSKNGSAWWVRKERHPMPSPAPVSLSLLSLIESDKWSILGSLAVLKVKRNARYKAKKKF